MSIVGITDIIISAEYCGVDHYNEIMINAYSLESVVNNIEKIVQYFIDHIGEIDSYCIIEIIVHNTDIVYPDKYEIFEESEPESEDYKVYGIRFKELMEFINNRELIDLYNKERTEYHLEMLIL